jgi:hypothetical protein
VATALASVSASLAEGALTWTWSTSALRAFTTRCCFNVSGLTAGETAVPAAATTGVLLAMMIWVALSCAGVSPALAVGLVGTMTKVLALGKGGSSTP